MKKKKPALKKATTKKPAAKSAASKKPAAKKPAAKPTAEKPAEKKTAPATSVVVADAPRRATYTPQPVQGIGWAPFRYPPQ
jgi:hypothetical protein